ncbi:glycine-rich domain-containing protein [Sorangium sp. So ce861]|uniref:glycine-rich domain-containing protein n=1 Tax=Sorangium sp. So ce861 TaxID=3133323 RepID=UPI003F60D25D
MESQLSFVSVDLVRAAQRSEEYFKDANAAQLQSALERYTKFLQLAARHPDRRLAPTREIDHMWHLHMLHPRAYQNDCQRLLGSVLDHDGGFGADPEELPALQQAFAETAALWEREFGEPYVQEPGTGSTSCWHNCQSRCWHACSKK